MKGKSRTIGNMINRGIKAIYPRRLVTSVRNVIRGKKTAGNVLNTVIEPKLKMNKFDRLRKKKLDTIKANVQKQRIAITAKAAALEKLRKTRRNKDKVIANEIKYLKNLIRVKTVAVRRATAEARKATLRASRKVNRTRSNRR
jgi:hypothetical protein